MATDPTAFFARLRELDQLCDFTITSNGTEWKVHRLVLSAHSKVLEKACSGDFAGRLKEASHRTLDLSEYDHDIVDGLVEYLYHFKYDSATEKHHQHQGALTFHVQMCILGDKYDMESLKNVAAHQFKLTLRTNCSPEDFADAARYAYDASPVTEEIRKAIVSKATQDPKVGVDPEGKTPFEDVMEEYPELAVAIAKAACANSEDRWSYFECGNCAYPGRQKVLTGKAVPACPWCQHRLLHVNPAKSLKEVGMAGMGPFPDDLDMDFQAYGAWYY
ncbi:hypothetical protein PRZ48_009873 [Zasmidium cellare]|uniref:BTB domain-containing protein n=1 Tax=Zasmidium cellare TaxID=395010 RepID=A0ABR0EDJ5_ZASCE|nr:hypothetical protein PRZ48_009873 [Zasmidium cellare]